MIFTNYHLGIGLEVLGFNYACTRSPPVSGMVTTTSKVRFFLKPALGGTNVFTPSGSLTVTSKPYPDPNNAANQCGGGNQTYFDTGDFPGSELLGCPRDPSDPPYSGPSFDPNDDLCEAGLGAGNINLGVARGVSFRRVVFSDAVNGDYQNATTSGASINFTNFSIRVYSLAGAELWTRNFAQSDAIIGYLEPVLAGVGDFLNGDGIDELRVARIRGGASGSWIYTYTYFNIDSGFQIGSAVSFTVASP